jgi:hypothetical protein
MSSGTAPTTDSSGTLLDKRGATLMRVEKLLAVTIVVWAMAGAAADQPPKPTALTEKVEKRLVQLDVAVEGDPSTIRAITAKDLALYVGEHEVQGLIVDPLCADEPPPARPAEKDHAAEIPPSVAAPQVTRPRATFVLFFDQTHLTLAGREFALITARELINRLVVEGTRASIVSSARRLETFVAMTGDREKLLAGLETLRNDPRHIESYAETERNRKCITPFASCVTMKASRARSGWRQGGAPSGLESRWERSPRCRRRRASSTSGTLFGRRPACTICTGFVDKRRILCPGRITRYGSSTK